MSEESDIEERVASEQEDDGLDERGSDEHNSEEHDSEEQDSEEQDSEKDNSEEYDSEESGSENANGFLDMEAAESDGESEDGMSDTEQFFFPQFKKLPPELRTHIWEFFDPDLTAKARLFPLMVMNEPADELWESAPLLHQIAPAMAMLATHRESREIALKSYPDTLDMRGGRGVLRYNSEKDVIFITGRAIDTFELEQLIDLLGNTKYLACEENSFRLSYTPEPNVSTRERDQLKGIFRCFDSSQFRRQSLSWCGSDSVLKFHSQHTEKVHDEEEVVEFLYCWPDIEKHRQFAEDNAYPYEGEVLGRKIWPVIEFAFARGLARYHEISDAVSRGENWEDLYPSDYSNPDQSGSESGIEDEYESDGIDDATIGSDGDLSEEEDDLVVHSGIEEDVEEEEDNVSAINGFSPLQDENPELRLGDEAEAANFSSLEPESPTPGASSTGDVSDEEPPRNAVRRKRRIVSSDDEHDSEDERDEEVKTPSRPVKRSRVVLSDTEDEEDEDAVQHNHNAVGGSESDDNSGGEEDSDGSENEYDGPIQSKPMSIFEKLKQFREENPIPPDSDDDSHTEASFGEDEFDGSDGINFQDDEVGDMDEMDNDGEAMGMYEELPEGEEEDVW
ncbi:hypothetical protein F4819DRAFT_474177 [Hypoxylon fuscum]|nr:hypothetical protein F4819DRAFT_474177 [Hypoxylon fuscum]